MVEMSDSLVSIIIPVYNTRQYIDRCIKSVLNQTYRKVEIILIDDGSTDGSKENCLYWASKDSRIIFESKKNEGLSATRNRGVERSHGKYIMFVDSDDWVDSKFVEKMVMAIEHKNADLGICDYFKINAEGEKHYILCNSIFDDTYSKEEYLLLSNTSVCNKIIRKGFWLKYNLQFQNRVSEDTVLFPELILLSEKIAEINEPLYYYQKFRENSITSTISNRSKFAEAYQSTIDYFQRSNIYEKYESILYRYFLEWTSNSLSPCLGKVDYNSYGSIRQTFINFLTTNFKEKKLKKLAVYGGYNLTKIAKMTSLFADPYCRFQFSSLISLKPDGVRGTDVPKHRNIYRNFMLCREYNNEFYRVLDDEKPDYIIIDFIEERHDILITNNGYYTYSDALQESAFYKTPKLLKRTDDKCNKVWETACQSFVMELKKRFDATHVILVKNYLAELYVTGSTRKKFHNIDEIREINVVLKNYYQFFEECFKGIHVIESFNDLIYFTDAKYEYGCFPWHLNDTINYSIANSIERVIC